MSALLFASAVAGCGYRPGADQGRLEALWQMGERTVAIEEARAVIANVAEANEVEIGQVQERARAIREQLLTEPIPPVDAAGSRPDSRFSLAGGTLDMELQSALEHEEAIVMIRAAVTVGELKLNRHAMGLLAMITRPGPVRLYTRLSSLESPMMAWLTAKQVALDSLLLLTRP